MIYSSNINYMWLYYRYNNPSKLTRDYEPILGRCSKQKSEPMSQSEIWAVICIRNLGRCVRTKSRPLVSVHGLCNSTSSMRASDRIHRNDFAARRFRGSRKFFSLFRWCAFEQIVWLRASLRLLARRLWCRGGT